MPLATACLTVFVNACYYENSHSSKMPAPALARKVPVVCPSLAWELRGKARGLRDGTALPGV
jgi:hypothetical protein